MHSKKIDHQWTRVSGTDIQPQHSARMLLNDSTLKNHKFISACRNAGIPGTRRQASKFRRKKGKAYQSL